MAANTTAKRKFEVDDLFRFEFILEAQLSPDGGKVIYTLLRIDENQEKEYKNFWLIDLENNSTTQMTFGDYSDNSPVWSPDGRSVVFLSNRDGKTQIYRLDIESGAISQIATLEQGCGGPLIWSPDGKKLAFHAMTAQPTDLSKPYRITRMIYRRDGAGLVDNIIKQIYLLDIETGKIQQMTKSPCNYFATAWSQDSKQILLLTNLAPDAINIDASIQVLDIEKGIKTILTNDWGRIDNAIFLNDGRIAFIGTPAGNLAGTKNDLWIINSDGSGIECRTRSLENFIEGRFHYDCPVPWGDYPPPILTLADGTDAVICLQQGGEGYLYRVTLRGEEKFEQIADGQRFNYPFNRVAEKVLFGFATLVDPTQLSLLDLSNGQEQQLTHQNKSLLEGIELPEVKNIHFKSSDSTPVEGWLMIPPGTPPFPTILHIHGGPHAAYGNEFSFDFLTLAGAGYAVIFINHRGSTGYGNAFANATHTDWGNLDYQDLMAGVDHAIDLGIADPKRLGCCGVSGGGNLTCWIIGHTDRFKAAVPENAMTSFASFYGTSDIGAKFAHNEMGSKPFEAPEVYARCSPITYAHRCKTPTLLVVGENDHRCPPEQSEQFYTALKANGCVAEMLRFPGGSHGAAVDGTCAMRRMHNEALLEWFDRYLV